MHTGKLPQDVNYMSPISSLLVGSPFWKETVFDCPAGGISRIQGDALFLSLTAPGMIHLQPNNECLQCGASSKSKRVSTIDS